MTARVLYRGIIRGLLSKGEESSCRSEFNCGRSFPYMPESIYFLKLSFRATARLNTRWPGAASRLSRQK